MKARMNDLVGWVVLGIGIAVAFGAVIHMEWLLK